jgi:hypothetical protein
MKAMDTGKEFTGPRNLSNPSQFTMLQLAEKSIKANRDKKSIDF